jgi:hypothetical protein
MASNSHTCTVGPFRPSPTTVLPSFTACSDATWHMNNSQALLHVALQR